MNKFLVQFYLFAGRSGQKLLCWQKIFLPGQVFSKSVFPPFSKNLPTLSGSLLLNSVSSILCWLGYLRTSMTPWHLLLPQCVMLQLHKTDFLLVTSVQWFGHSWRNPPWTHLTLIHIVQYAISVPFQKILQHVINSRLAYHANRFGEISPVQSAYSKKHSTETALVKIHNDLGGSVAATFLLPWQHAKLKPHQTCWLVVCRMTDGYYYCKGLHPTVLTDFRSLDTQRFFATQKPRGKPLSLLLSLSPEREQPSLIIAINDRLL